MPATTQSTSVPPHPTGGFGFRELLALSVFPLIIGAVLVTTIGLRPHPTEQPIETRRQLSVEQRERQRALLGPVRQRYDAGQLVGAPAEPLAELFGLADEADETSQWAYYFFGDRSDARERFTGHFGIRIERSGDCPRVADAGRPAYVP